MILSLIGPGPDERAIQEEEEDLVRMKKIARAENKERLLAEEIPSSY